MKRKYKMNLKVPRIDWHNPSVFLGTVFSGLFTVAGGVLYFGISSEIADLRRHELMEAEREGQNFTLSGPTSVTRNSGGTNYSYDFSANTVTIDVHDNDNADRTVLFHEFNNESAIDNARQAACTIAADFNDRRQVMKERHDLEPREKHVKWANNFHKFICQ